ncbi:MAG: hypothetical protein MZW92_76760 [Comamonadaceae bacterium]|nr:hypothetical protein [Comamonadaceae bacterium]
MRSVIAILSAVLISGCATVAGAGPLLDVEIVSRSSGRVLETYAHRGRTYVAGKPGEGYAVRLVNRSRGRLLAVLSVDGVERRDRRNRLPGPIRLCAGTLLVGRDLRLAQEPGGGGPVLLHFPPRFLRGPLRPAGERWRHRCRGVPRAAAATPPIRNWRRPGPRRPLPHPPPGPAGQPRTPLAESAAPDASRKESRERLGTGHGAREYAPTEYTEFVRAGSKPDDVVAIRYDSYDNLLARGIVPHRPRYADPQPFPRRFVPDPRG